MTGSYTGEARDPKHLKEPKHSTTVKNQKTSQQYCTVLLLVFVLLLVLLDFYSRISGMSSVDTWPKAVQNCLKALTTTLRCYVGTNCPLQVPLVHDEKRIRLGLTAADDIRY